MYSVYPMYVKQLPHVCTLDVHSTYVGIFQKYALYIRGIYMGYIAKMCSAHSWYIHKVYSENVLYTFVAFACGIFRKCAVHVSSMYIHVYSDYIQYTYMHIHCENVQSIFIKCSFMYIPCTWTILVYMYQEC